MHAYETVDLTLRDGRPRSVPQESKRSLAVAEHASFAAAVRAADSLNELTASLARSLREALPTVESTKAQQSPLRREHTLQAMHVQSAPPAQTSTTCCCCLPGRVAREGEGLVHAAPGDSSVVRA